MSDKRRLVLITISVSIGMGISAFIFYMKNKFKPLNSEDFLWLGTNLFFSLLIVVGIGFYFLKKKKKDGNEQ